MAAGRTSKEIASELGISESTVNWHISNAFGRLGASSRAEAVALAMRDEAEQHSGNGVDKHSGNGADNGNGTDGGHGRSHETDVARRPAHRPSAPLVSTVSVFLIALMLLLSVLGGALVAGWQVTLTPPSSTALPTALPTGPAPTVAPTARPSGALAPQPGTTDAAVPERTTDANADRQTTGAPAVPSFAPGLSAPALVAPILSPGPVQAPTTQTALPSVVPLPTVLPLPTQLPVPTIVPNPSLP